MIKGKLVRTLVYLPLKIYTYHSVKIVVLVHSCIYVLQHLRGGVSSFLNNSDNITFPKLNYLPVKNQSM